MAANNILVPGSNGQTPALIADKVLSYPATPGFPASGPGGVANFTTATVSGAQVPVSAALELQSTTGAFIVPRMTAAQRLALVPTNGMDVYELDTQARWWYNNGSWTQVSTSGGGGGGDISGPGASTLNAIVSWNNTLGTTVKDNKAVVATSLTDANASDFTLVATIQASKTAGLIGSPNYSFTGDANTGMWSSAAETIDFSTSGARQFQINNTASTTSWIGITGSAGTPGLPTIKAFVGGGGPANVDILIQPFGPQGALVVTSGDGTAGGTIALLNAAGTAAATLSASAGLGASVSWILPTADATLANQPLVSDAAGNLSFYGTALSSFVAGPASATDNAIARFDTTTGKLIQDSAVTVADTTGTITLAANGQFVAGLGAVGAPSFTFLGDTNTGIYRSSAEHIAFAANGELQFVIADGAGTVINTLFVQGGATTVDPSFGINSTTDTNVDIAFAAKGTGGLLINPTSGTSASGLLKLATVGGANFVGFKAPATLSGDTTWTLPSTDGTSGQALVTDGAGTLSFANAVTLEASGTILNADAQGSNATPISLIPAAGAGTVIIVQRISFEFVGATPFVGAGNFVIEYGSVASGAGPLACGNISNGSFVGLGASTILFSNPTVASVVVSTAVNTGIFLSATTAFTGGGAINYNVQYYIMNVT